MRCQDKINVMLFHRNGNPFTVMEFGIVELGIWEFWELGRATVSI